MTDWQPFTVRRGQRPPIAMVDGVPEYLHASLERWIEEVSGFRGSRNRENEALLLQVARKIPINIPTSLDARNIMRNIIAPSLEDEDLMLDVLDAFLSLTDGHAESLDQVLIDGGSVWTISDDQKSLQHRVDMTTMESFREIMKAQNAVSEELSEAWSNAYGRGPNPSDSWDHAIKAVESSLIPIVCPKDAKATLGKIIGELSANPGKWKLEINTSSITLSSVETLTEMLRLIWVNPDRHGGSQGREPNLPEAQAVLQTAINVAHWIHLGILKSV